MKSMKAIFAGSSLVAVALVAWIFLRPGPLAAGPLMPDFRLEDQTGIVHELHAMKDARAIVLIGHGNSCPIIQKYTSRVNELKADYESRGVRFFYVNPNMQDDVASVRQEAEEYGFQVPILMDPAQIVARALQFQRTGETVILDTRNWRIAYHGPIDDRLDYGVDKRESRNNYLRDALDAFLSGRAVPQAGVEAKGCAYSYWATDKLAFTDLSSFVNAKCVSCHQAGGAAPDLRGEESLRAHAIEARKSMYKGTMPPTGSTPLSHEEKFKLTVWLEAHGPGTGGAGALASGQ